MQDWTLRFNMQILHRHPKHSDIQPPNENYMDLSLGGRGIVVEQDD